jgi:murein DD-endopeptidase MepM/ murein hydrolase activator NlpD
MAMVTVALATGSTLLPAHADDLGNKKQQAQHNVKTAQTDLEDSSTAAAAATKNLQAAQASLATAQINQARTEGELTTAQVLDTQMQARLVTAQSALTQAVADVVAGEAEVAAESRALAQIAVASYTYGDPSLMRISILLQGAEPDDIAVQLAALGNIQDQQAGTVQALRAAQKQLVIQRRKVKAAEIDVAEQRQAAAVNLANKLELEHQAAAASARVVRLIAVRRSAAITAVATQAADARKLAASKKQEARVEQAILAQARRAHHRSGFTGSTGAFLLPPVANSYITSPYGWRIHPIYGYWGLHNGDDFHAPCGVPEVASASGTVVSQYYSDVWGNRLFLDVGPVNGKDMTLIYNHISAYRSHVGEQVTRGQTIALAGTTGWSTGCHLHFTVMLDGTAVDPQKFM